MIDTELTANQIDVMHVLNAGGVLTVPVYGLFRPRLTKGDGLEVRCFLELWELDMLEGENLIVEDSHTDNETYYVSAESEAH